MKCEGWSRASPLPSAGRSGAQKFSTSPGPLWSSSGPALNSGALQTPFAAPQLPGGGARSLSNWQTRTAHPAGPACRAAPWGIRSTERTRGWPWAGAATGARRRRGPGRAWGRGNREETCFSGPLPRRALRRVAQSLWFLHLQILDKLPLRPSSPSWEKILARAVHTGALECRDWRLEITACCGMFSDSGLFWSEWKSFSRVWLFATPWTTQSMEFSRPEYWSG